MSIFYPGGCPNCSGCKLCCSDSSAQLQLILFIIAPVSEEVKWDPYRSSSIRNLCPGWVGLNIESEVASNHAANAHDSEKENGAIIRRHFTAINGIKILLFFLLYHLDEYYFWYRELFCAMSKPDWASTLQSKSLRCLSSILLIYAKR